MLYSLESVAIFTKSVTIAYFNEKLAVKIVVLFYGALLTLNSQRLLRYNMYVRILRVHAITNQ